jgi:hypothetical protein
MLPVAGELRVTFVARRLATGSSLQSGFGSAPQPFRKCSVVHEDRENSRSTE